jgi:acetyl esterase/lipase
LSGKPYIGATAPWTGFQAPWRPPDSLHFQPGLQYQAFADQPDAGTLDIAWRARGSASQPLMVFIHGGAWEVGDSTLDWSDQLYWAKQGYVTASLNYHLLLPGCEASDHPPPLYLPDGGVTSADGRTICPIAPQAISDVRCAVRYLLTHASTYAIDPSNLFVSGSSAGAHLAALLALSSGTSVFDVADGPGACSDLATPIPPLRGANLFYPPTNLGNGDWETVLADGGTFDFGGAFAVETLIGTPEIGAGVNAPNYVTYSPVAHVTAPLAPPFFIANGSADNSVPPAQSRELYEALQNAGVPSTYYEVPDGGHGFQRYADCPASSGCGQGANYLPAECTAIRFVLQQVPLH